MSAQPLPPLNQSGTDFESDSEYIGTPVDPPSVGQPQVAGYEPLGDYYYPSLTCDIPERAAGHPVPQYRYSDPGPAGPQQTAYLEHGYYETAQLNQCTPRDRATSEHQWLGSGHAVGMVEGAQRSSCSPGGGVLSTTDEATLEHHPQSDSPYAQHRAVSLQYSDATAERAVYSDNNQIIYPIARHRHPQLYCDTNVNYPLAESQRTLAGPASAIFPAAASYIYPDEGYVDSPVDEAGHCDFLATSGCAHESSGGYSGNPQAGSQHLDTHLPSSHAPLRQQVQGFYQGTPTHFMYPVLDGSVDAAGYPSDSRLVHSGMYLSQSVIHAPRPQQVHDIHNLHDSTYPPGGSPGRLQSHQVLSIPTGPLQPIPRPSSLIEDNPKKPLTLACFFCRKRKIACQSPPANSLDRTCNQCAKRKLKCVYPATSRRGVRPRVYDIQDDHLPRPSVPISL